MITNQSPRKSCSLARYILNLSNRCCTNTLITSDDENKFPHRFLNPGCLVVFFSMSLMIHQIQLIVRIHTSFKEVALQANTQKTRKNSNKRLTLKYFCSNVHLRWLPFGLNAKQSLLLQLMVAAELNLSFHLVAGNCSKF